MKQINKKYVEDTTLFEKYSSILEGFVGRMNSISMASGGLVNYIYRVEGELGALYVKIRKDRFSALQHLQIDPADIRYESTALDTFSAEFPEIFPRKLAFYLEDAMIIMSDVIKDGVRLDNALADGMVSEDIAGKLGAIVGAIHERFRDTDISIREDGDSEYYSRNLEYRLGYHKNYYLDSLISRLGLMHRQLIMGDLSPKNICVGDDGRVAMWDLETAHRGNAVFDIGFLSAHIILHSRGRNGIGLLCSLMDGYYSSTTTRSFDEINFKHVVLGIILFRMHNQIIPYMTEVGAEERRKISNHASLLLSQRDPSWLDIVRCAE